MSTERAKRGTQGGESNDAPTKKQKPDDGITTAPQGFVVLAAAPATSNPTWLNPIKGYFRPMDIGCMSDHFNLGAYGDVVKQATHIYGQLKNQWMPMDGAYWSDEKLATFEKWMADGYPFGTQPAKPMSLLLRDEPPPSRLRKCVNDLTPAEVTLLKNAFIGMMKKPIDDPNSYFALASFHGLPNPMWCWHHFFGFLPWHRVYTTKFENALRTVPGCQNVTLPYWDMASDKLLPEWLWQAPFDAYTYPTEIANAPEPRGANSKTIRASRAYVTDPNARAYMKDNLTKAMLQTPSWEEFADYSNAQPDKTKPTTVRVAVEMIHDFSHVLTGGGLPEDFKISAPSGIPTGHKGDMVYQEITAFDPIFWFTHCEFDRLCWEWQKRHDATTVDGLTNTFKTNDPTLRKMYLDAKLIPWDDTFRTWVDLSKLPLGDGGIGIGYSPGTFSSDQTAAVPIEARPMAHAAPARFNLKAGPVGLVVWLKNVNRTKIMGSFNVKLFHQANEQSPKEMVGFESCFNRINPQACENCNEKPLLDFGFNVQEAGGIYSFEIWKVHGSQPMRLDRVGNPHLEITATLQ